MDDNITLTHPGEDDVNIDTTELEGTKEGWTVPDEDPLPTVEEAEPGDEGTEAVEDAEPSPPPQWDGDPAKVPPELQDTYKQMVSGMNKKFRELAETRKEMEAERERYRKLAESQTKQPAEDGEPPLPDKDDSYEVYVHKMDARNKWHADQAAKRYSQEFAPRVQTQEERVRQMEAMQRYNNLKAQPGFNEEVEAKMLEMAEASQHWQQALQSDDGTTALFKMAQYELAADKHHSAEIQHKTAAKKRAVSRPKSAPKEVTPADRFADSFEEMGREAAAEHGLDWR